ncbi:MAG: hypothetical protein ACK49I_09485 [Verrucomicrobiota bacterium]
MIRLDSQAFDAKTLQQKHELSTAGSQIEAIFPVSVNFPMALNMGVLSAEISPDLAHAGSAQPLILFAVLFSVKSR